MPFLFFLLWPGIYSDPFSISLKNIKISAGKFKPTCSFEISYNDDRVSKANVYCTSLKKTVKGIQYEYVTRTRHKIELTFTLPRKKRTAVVTNKKVETSRIYELYPLVFTFRILVPCQLGYAIICNSSKSSEEKTSICPADNFVKLHFEIKTFLPFFNFRILGIPRT